VQQDDNTSILNYYKRAIKLRNQNPEIARGEIKIIEELTEGNQAVITKTYNDTTIAIIYNTSDEDMQINLTSTILEQMQLRGYLTLNNEAITLENKIVNMPPQSICILK
jgi:glycosidase